MVEYKLLEPGEGEKEDVMRLVREFLPILDRFLEERGRAWYRSEKWEVHPGLFAQMWLERNLFIFLAREGDETVGFPLGWRPVPLISGAPAFEVEAYYGATPEIERGLLETLKEASRFFAERNISFPDYGGPGGPGAFFGHVADQPRAVYRK